MGYLLHAFAGQLQFPIRRLLRFLDKRVKNHGTPAYEKTVERPSNARSASRSQFE
jgi:hypothetical protein